MKQFKTVLVFVLFNIVLSGVVSLECYSCMSLTDVEGEGCTDPMNATEIVWKTCSAQNNVQDDSNTKRHLVAEDEFVCAKLSYTSGNGQNVIERGCIFIEMGDKDICTYLEESIEQEGQNITNFNCSTCDSDLCNSY